jgi:tRNA pseudouridine55 synthase
MDGIVVVNKPADITSYDVIRRLKKVFDTKKIGHGGSLDPFATGVLVIAVNEATKIIRYFLDSDKEYIAKLKMGEMTDTHDLTGKVIKRKEGLAISRESFTSVLKEFIGGYRQLPPMYSAKKAGGVKLYKMARKGIEIERKRVSIHIEDIRLLEYSYPFAVVKVNCSKGTYIRVLANDIGLSLGTYAHLVELKRTASGPFDIKRAAEIDELALAKEEGRLDDYVIGLNDALGFMPAATVKDSAVKKVRHGISLKAGDLKSEPDYTGRELKDGHIKLVSENGALLAIADYPKDGDDRSKGEYKYKRVFLKNS